MLKMRLLALLSLATALLTACTLPLSTEERSPTWVPNVELEVVRLVQSGLGFTTSGRLIDAELSFLQALVLKPNSPNIYLDLIVVLERQGRIDEALVLIEKLLKEYPTSARFREGRARLLALNLNFSEAEIEYQNALKIAQSDPRQKMEVAGILRSLSALQFLIGDEEQAVCFALEESSQAFSKEALTRVAKLRNGMNQPRLALKAIEQGVLAGAPKGDIEILKQLGIAHLSLGELEVGAKFISRALGNEQSSQGVSFDLLLLKHLYPLAEKETKSDPKRPKGEEIVEEEADEESEEEISNPLDDQRVVDLSLRSDLTLYWPVELVRKVEQEFIARTALLPLQAG